MNKVLDVANVVITGFLNWVYSLPPDSVKEYEIALVAYLISVGYINPTDKQAWMAAGFAAYGIVKAIRDVSNASVTKTLNSNKQ